MWGVIVALAGFVGMALKGIFKFIVGYFITVTKYMQGYHTYKHFHSLLMFPIILFLFTQLIDFFVTYFEISNYAYEIVNYSKETQVAFYLMNQFYILDSISLLITATFLGYFTRLFIKLYFIKGL